MKISVITVTRNSGKTIIQTMESMARQTHGDIEHIVVDGLSSDDTLALVGRYAGPATIVISERDSGIYDGMNKGLARATGEVICFLNSDDRYATPHVLSDVVKAMQSDDLDALLGDVSFFPPGSPEKTIRRYRSGAFKPERLAWGLMPAHPATFLRRRVVDRVGKFQTSYRIAGDFEYMCRVFSDHRTRYGYLPEILVRMQSGGASTAGIRSKLLLNREVLRACRENGIDTNLLKVLSKYPAKLLELVRR